MKLKASKSAATKQHGVRVVVGQAKVNQIERQHFSRFDTVEYLKSQSNYVMAGWFGPMLYLELSQPLRAQDQKHLNKILQTKFIEAHYGCVDHSKCEQNSWRLYVADFRTTWEKIRDFFTGVQYWPWSE